MQNLAFRQSKRRLQQKYSLRTNVLEVHVTRLNVFRPVAQPVHLLALYTSYSANPTTVLCLCNGHRIMMMSCRSKDVDLPVIGKARAEAFLQSRLPTSREVLQRFIYYLKVTKTTQNEAINITCDEVICLWKKIADGSTTNYKCYKSTNSTKTALQNLWNQYKKIKTSLRPDRQRSKKAITEEREFNEKLNKLFDISKPDVKVHLSREDLVFLQDQQGPRKFTFGGKDRVLEKRISRKRSAEESFLLRKSNSDKEKAFAVEVTEAADLGSSDVTINSSESSMSGDDVVKCDTFSAKKSFVTLNVPKKITSLPQVVAAADRHKLSSNALNDVLSALIKDSGGDVNDFILSTSTTLRFRKVARSKEFQLIQSKFATSLRDQFFSIHWDEKLLKQGNDYQPKEHIAILSSHGDDIKLLGTTRLESGSGFNQANAIKSFLDEWNIQELCLAMCFDSTSSNIGKFNGACILLEALLGHPLLWTACRHHVLEVVLSNVAKLIFGVSTGPKIECFDILSHKWTKLDLHKKTSHMVFNDNVLKEHALEAKSKLVNILSDQKSYIPRDDYRELLQLSIYYIDSTTFSNFEFRRPGPHYRARWMSSAIYSLKMLLLRDQLELDEEVIKKLQLFGDFVACFYAPNWFSAPLASEAAVQDLTLYQVMLRYSKNSNSPLQDIATTVTISLKRHL